ncbi:uncharacterized protein AB675_1164 [Cyphellophora attinorum]|uniref:Uncharacterized protein n=1 Tax=Cyphellophora attinorum TaxID=1664694 RepID=A0A0N1H6W6_9EURO|nr:uncharacterized protein AB675_1164 [Phialophora attinorum]KPI38163.1 hypothetical protein AB675_1164 [Phialophora attinorum]
MPYAAPSTKLEAVLSAMRAEDHTQAATATKQRRAQIYHADEKPEDDSKEDSGAEAKDDSKDDSDDKAESKDDGGDEKPEKDTKKDDNKDEKGDDDTPSDDSADGVPNHSNSQYFRNPNMKPGEGKQNRPPTEKKGEKDAASNFSGAKHPAINDPSRSKKSHGPMETAKIHGTVKPTYADDNFGQNSEDSHPEETKNSKNERQE